MNIGEKIKQVRKIKGMTQKDLSNKAEIGLSSLIRYEKGEREIPTTTLIKIVDVLEMDWLDLFEGKQPDKETMQKNHEAQIEANILFNAESDLIMMFRELELSDLEVLISMAKIMVKANRAK